MPTVSDLKKSLMELDIRSLTEGIIKSNEQLILNLNREDQIMNKGIDSMGQSLFNYSPRTQFIFDADPNRGMKGSDKEYGSPYNLYWTGKSYNSFTSYIRGNSLFITANSRARKLLIENGGSNIFGLTPDNQEILNFEIILPKLQDAIKKQIL